MNLGDYYSINQPTDEKQPIVEVIGVDYKEPYKDRTPRTPSYYSEK